MFFSRGCFQRWRAFFRNGSRLVPLRSSHCEIHHAKCKTFVTQLVTTPVRYCSCSQTLVTQLVAKFDRVLCLRSNTWEGRENGQDRGGASCQCPTKNALRAAPRLTVQSGQRQQAPHNEATLRVLFIGLGRTLPFARRAENGRMSQ